MAIFSHETAVKILSWKLSPYQNQTKKACDRLSLYQYRRETWIIKRGYSTGRLRLCCVHLLASYFYATTCCKLCGGVTLWRSHRHTGREGSESCCHHCPGVREGPGWAEEGEGPWGWAEQFVFESLTSLKVPTFCTQKAVINTSQHLGDSPNGAFTTCTRKTQLLFYLQSNLQDTLHVFMGKIAKLFTMVC